MLVNNGINATMILIIVMMNKNDNRNDNGVPILISLFTAVLHYNCNESPPPDDVVLPAFIRNSNLGGIENK